MQRFDDQNDFGIDLIRNGRAIRIEEKSAFFEFIDEDTKKAEKEYPIDQQYGRIVGEVHLDHVPVDFSKQDFQRTSDEWHSAYRADVPTWHSHWHYAYDKEIIFPEPVGKLRVRYVGKPGVNGVRVNVHSLKPDESPSQSVAVTHGFRTGGELHERRFTFDEPTDYSIECPEEPEDVFIVVGAGHLIGPESVIDLLKQKGYKVRQR